MKILMRPAFFFGLMISWLLANSQTNQFTLENGKYSLTMQGAEHLASLPMRCITQEFPYKTGVTFSDSTLIIKPKNYHPAFYGCFDWHSSVHGHWMLVRLLKVFPTMKNADQVRAMLRQQLSYQNIQGEIKLFSTKENKTFERTYGWAWVLELQKELIEWNDPFAKQLAGNIEPLAQLFSGYYREYLKKLAYPVRVGEHSNLAFALRLAYDYAVSAKDDSLKNAISETALRFFNNDEGCPIKWEPGGTDFLSPCLEEADLMWRILPSARYQKWLNKFLPGLLKNNFKLPVGEVKDRSDGRLVHLDGLNFSRAWCLYGIADHVTKNKKNLLALANKHMSAALPHVASGEYMGEHWLASFAVYALTALQNN